jgi:6-phosphofructokinase 1
MIYASTVDIEEAYSVGEQAVKIAVTEGTSYMATIRREPGPNYTVSYDKAPLTEMANSERVFPKDWIALNRIDVTDEFLRYARPLIGEISPSVPLIGGLQRFARLKPLFAEKKCLAYIPSEYR